MVVVYGVRMRLSVSAEKRREYYVLDDWKGIGNNRWIDTCHITERILEGSRICQAGMDEMYTCTCILRNSLSVNN